MKSKQTILLSLVLMMPLALLAASRNSAHVTLDNAVTVEGTQVPAGDYRVQWEGTGTSVIANFMQGKKSIASVPATLVEGKTPYDGAIDTAQGNVLQAIEWKNQSLHFDQTDGSSVAGASSTSK